MFLTIALVGVVVLLLTVGFAAFAYEPDASGPQPQPALEVGQPRFFADGARRPVADSEVPIALVLARLEQHIRYEDAAVEAFLVAPRRETLYSQTTSAWVN